ncbi:hypothetical protein BDF21DRAFT_426749 [Thamnidium elegans]|nr:hypothetical protein BDF21DRAFT_426749 [Thamnidium elegans]
MADYWVSQQRHWCKYCKKYVANNKPSISLHENGRSHKDQVERFLRGVYTKGRKDIEDAEEVRQELERIERAAAKAMGIAYVPTSTATKKSTDYYVDPTVPTIEELRQQALEESQQTPPAAVEGREEWAVNTEIAKVGEWETVVAQPTLTHTNNDTNKDDKTDGKATHDQVAQFQDDDEDEEDLHSFKIKEKELDIPTEEEKEQETVTFKKRKLGDSAIKSRKKKPLRKKD